MSSANLPRPRNRRSSSLRGSAAPTQGRLPFFSSSAMFSLTPFFQAQILGALPNISRTGGSAPHELCQRSLQPVDHFLNLFLAQRFEQAAGDGGQAAEDLGFALPIHFCSKC